MILRQQIVEVVGFLVVFIYPLAERKFVNLFVARHITGDEKHILFGHIVVNDKYHADDLTELSFNVEQIVEFMDVVHHPFKPIQREVLHFRAIREIARVHFQLDVSPLCRVEKTLVERPMLFPMEQRIATTGHRNPLRPFLAEHLVERFLCAEIVCFAHFQPIVSYDTLRAGVMTAKVRNDADILSGVCVDAAHRRNCFFTFHLVHLFHCPIRPIRATAGGQKVLSSARRPAVLQSAVLFLLASCCVPLLGTL